MSDAIAGNDPLKKAIDEHKGQLTGAPLAHYEERFAAADPELAAARCGVAFERAAEGGGVFRLTVLGRPLEMAWPSMEARYADGEGAVPDKMRIVVAELILDGQLAPGTGKFIPYSEKCVLLTGNTKPIAKELGKLKKSGVFGNGHLKAVEGFEGGFGWLVNKNNSEYKNVCKALHLKAI